MAARRLMALLLATLALASPLGAAGAGSPSAAGDCDQHAVHGAAHGAGHEQHESDPPPAGDCPHCADTTCAAVMACGGVTAARDTATTPTVRAGVAAGPTRAVLPAPVSRTAQPPTPPPPSA